MRAGSIGIGIEWGTVRDAHASDHRPTIESSHKSIYASECFEIAYTQLIRFPSFVSLYFRNYIYCCCWLVLFVCFILLSAAVLFNALIRRFRRSVILLLHCYIFYVSKWIKMLNVVHGMKNYAHNIHSGSLLVPFLTYHYQPFLFAVFAFNLFLHSAFLWIHWDVYCEGKWRSCCRVSKQFHNGMMGRRCSSRRAFTMHHPCTIRRSVSTSEYSETSSKEGMIHINAG